MQCHWAVSIKTFKINNMKNVLKLIASPIKLLLCWYYKIPRKCKNVWYNRSCYIEKENYPVIFNDDKSYIPCQKGSYVVMGKTKEGENIYYKVIKRWATRGGDWLADSDAVNCDLEFSYIK